MRTHPSNTYAIRYVIVNNISLELSSLNLQLISMFKVDVMVTDSLVSSISLVINMVHLATLVKFSQKTNNYITMVHLCLADICRAVIGTLLSNCAAQILLVRLPAVCTISAIINDVTVSITLITLTVATADRYIAVCKPFTYVTHPLSVHFKKLTVISWFIVIVYSSVIAIALEGACVSGSKTCSIYSTKPSYIIYLGVALLLCAFCHIIVSFCFIKIMLELHSMTKHHQIEARSSIKTTVLIGIITALFYIFYLPLIFSIIAAIAGHVLGPRASGYLYSLVTVSGIFNTIAYGWLKQQYRKQLRAVFCGTNHLEDGPMVDQHADNDMRD